MKKFVLFTSMRTGSTMISRILKSHDNIQYIGKMFKIDGGICIEDTGSEIISLRKSRCDPSYYDYDFMKKSIEDQKNELNRRNDLLDKYNYKNYSFGVMGHKMSNRTLKYIINNNYPIIFLERKDKWDQILSFITAEHTGSWLLERFDTKVNNEPFIADYEKSKLIFDDILLYYKWKTIIREKVENICFITYEDLFLNDNYDAIKQKIGLEIETSTIYPLKKVRTLTTKEQIIININEVKNWFDDWYIYNKDIIERP